MKDGWGMVEIIVVLSVLIVLVLAFRNQIIDLLFGIIDLKECNS